MIGRKLWRWWERYTARLAEWFPTEMDREIRCESYLGRLALARAERDRRTRGAVEDR